MIIGIGGVAALVIVIIVCKIIRTKCKKRAKKSNKVVQKLKFYGDEKNQKDVNTSKETKRELVFI